MANESELETIAEQLKELTALSRANLFGILSENLSVDEVIHQLHKNRQSRDVQEIKEKL